MKNLILMSLLMLVGSTVYAGSVNYTYDNLGRVVKIAYSNGKSVSYNYDAAGNRVSVISTG